MIGSWEIRPRDWVFTGLIVAGVVALMFLVPGFSSGPDCTTRLIETRSALTASDHEIAALPNQDRTKKCAAYRARAEILTRVAPIARICGTPQVTRSGAYREFDSEMSFYNRLVGEQCS